jgi:hypothetical protein
MSPWHRLFSVQPDLVVFTELKGHEGTPLALLIAGISRPFDIQKYRKPFANQAFTLANEKAYKGFDQSDRTDEP